MNSADRMMQHLARRYYGADTMRTTIRRHWHGRNESHFARHVVRASIRELRRMEREQP